VNTGSLKHTVAQSIFSILAPELTTCIYMVSCNLSTFALHFAATAQEPFSTSVPE